MSTKCSSSSTGYLYLLRHAGILNTHVYKIGRTKNPRKRLSNYPKGSFFILTLNVYDYKIEEQKLIKILSKTPGITRRLDIGNEFFEGNIRLILNAFNAIAILAIADRIENDDHDDGSCTDDPTTDIHVECLVDVVKSYIEQRLIKTNNIHDIISAQDLYNDFKLSDLFNDKDNRWFKEQLKNNGMVSKKKSNRGIHHNCMVYYGVTFKPNNHQLDQLE